MEEQSKGKETSDTLSTGSDALSLNGGEVTDKKSQDSKEEEQRPTKKRRVDEAGTAVATNVSSEGKGKPARKAGTPFRRVDPSKVNVGLLLDNRYENKVCKQSSTKVACSPPCRRHQRMIMEQGPMRILLSLVGQAFARRKTRKREGVIEEEKLLYVVSLPLRLPFFDGLL